MKNTFTYLFISIACFLFFNSAAQNSAEVILRYAKHDTTKLRLLVQMTEECELNEIIKYADAAIKLSDRLLQNSNLKNHRSKILKFKGQAINNIGYYYTSTGNADKAYNYYTESLKIQEEIGDKQTISDVLNNIGAVHQSQGDIPKAIECYGRSLKLREELGDKFGIAGSLDHLGLIYYGQGHVDAAIDFYKKALKLREEINDKSGIANTLNNMGTAYRTKGDIRKSLDYYKVCLKIQEEIGDKESTAITMMNIGSIYITLRDSLPAALNYFKRSLIIEKEAGNKQAIAYAFNNMSISYFKMALLNAPASRQKNYRLAFAYTDSSLAIAKELGFPEAILSVEQIRSQIDSATGNFNGALEHYKQFILYKDSISNEGTRKASIKNQIKYEFEKKEAVLREQQEKERAIAEEKNRFQKIVIASVVVGLLLVIIFAGFIFRSLKITRKQKVIIEEKQKEILDSINYARRIQRSLLPNEKYISKSLNRLGKK